MAGVSSSLFLRRILVDRRGEAGRTFPVTREPLGKGPEGFEATRRSAGSGAGHTATSTAARPARSRYAARPGRAGLSGRQRRSLARPVAGVDHAENDRAGLRIEPVQRPAREQLVPDPFDENGGRVRFSPSLRDRSERGRASPRRFIASTVLSTSPRWIRSLLALFGVSPSLSIRSIHHCPEFEHVVALISSSDLSPTTATKFARPSVAGSSTAGPDPRSCRPSDPLSSVQDSSSARSTVIVGSRRRREGRQLQAHPVRRFVRSPLRPAQAALLSAAWRRLRRSSSETPGPGPACEPRRTGPQRPRCRQRALLPRLDHLSPRRSVPWPWATDSRVVLEAHPHERARLDRRKIAPRPTPLCRDRSCLPRGLIAMCCLTSPSGPVPPVPSRASCIAHCIAKIEQIELAIRTKMNFSFRLNVVTRRCLKSIVAETMGFEPTRPFPGLLP